jgi:hypothetical protein
MKSEIFTSIGVHLLEMSIFNVLNNNGIGLGLSLLQIVEILSQLYQLCS